MPPLVTTMPAAVETSSAGICDTRPSPAVSVVKVAAASAKRHAVPHQSDGQAAQDVDHGDDQAAIASPRTNSRRRPWRRRSRSPPPAPAAAARLLLVDEAGREVGVDRHLLAGHRIQAEPRGDLGDAAGPLGDDHEVHHQQDGEDDQADQTSPPIRKPPNAATTWPAASGPSLPCDRIRRVTATFSDRRSSVVSSSSVREGGKVERPVEEQRDHQDQHRRGDRERQAEVQQQGRQRQYQDGQQRDHAEGEADIAARREPARATGQRRKLRVGWQAVSHGDRPLGRHARGRRGHGTPCAA